VDKNSILIVGARPEVEERLSAALGQQNAITTVPDAGSARRAVQKGPPTLAVVSLRDGAAADATDLVRELTSVGSLVVVQGASKEPEAILSAMRAGAREFVVAGEDQELEKRVEGLLERSGALRVGQVTAVFPVKGGMGATTLATQLAGAFHRRGGKRVCLVDLDLELGDVLSFLDLPGKYSLADVAANARRLDRELLDSSVPRHSSGVWVLSQCEKVGEADRIDAAGLGSMLRFLRQCYDHVVLDGLRDFGDLPLAALDVADRVLVVATQEVPAVRNAQRCADLFRQLGYDAKRLMLLLNRYQKGSPITREVVEETVGLRVAATVGNDFHALSRAVNRGVLIWDEAPRSVVARDLDALAALVDGTRAEAAEKPPLLKKFLSPLVAAYGTK
jgi:pilus assembly protein CpaE